MMIQKDTALLLGLFLCLLLTSLQALAGTVVTRTVSADAFAQPSRAGAVGACPQKVGGPEAGDTVRLLLRPDMGRRDEPDVSFIVRLRDGEAFVLYHASRSFTKFTHPPESGKLATTFRGTMGSAAGEVFPYRLDGEVQRSTKVVHEMEVAHRTATVESPLLGRLEAEVLVAPDSALGPVAFATESFAQRVRRAGEEWLTALGPPDGIPLRIAQDLHQPSARVAHHEDFVSLESVELDDSRFLPPPDYTQAAHDPDCVFDP